jgi:cholesterol oxidase
MRDGGTYDVIVIGSGFGGSVTALRLTEKGYRVAVLEAGRRFTSTTYARSSWNLRRFLWFPWLGLRGIQRIDLLSEVMVLSGAGVGGGSLVYANTLIEPQAGYYTDPQWGSITDWRDELAPHYDIAKRMLGVVPAPNDTAADGVIESLGRHFGAETSFKAADVGVHFGRPGREESDPFFGGAGPRRAGCIECGGCMVGCRYNAKNTLDRNYLYLAEQAGAAVFPDSEVVDVRPDGGGYVVETRRPGALLFKRPRRYAAGQVVFAAGALGTTRLLLRLRDRGSLPHLSDRVGHLVRTNSEAIVGSVARTTATDYSRGVAITSSIEPAPDTRIEPVRYPAGSNSMGLLATILVPGGKGPQAIRYLGAVLRHPIAFLRSLSVRRWSERGLVLLVMQSIDNSLRLHLKRGRFRTRVGSAPGHGMPNPRWLPVAHEAARAAARVMGGDAAASANESILGIPLTAHILGGACIGADPATGVVDPYHRIFGHPGLHVVDGAAVSANLGSNPSLSITALAERATAMWPNRDEEDTRPPLGEPYRPVAAVPPLRPTVPDRAPAALRRQP